jgi:hypothetical protein
MDQHRGTGGNQPADVAATSSERYEPPLITELGSFQRLTAGHSSGGKADETGKTYY